MSVWTFALGKTLSGWLWPENGAPPPHHQALRDFVTGFILPHENAYAKGHYGDPAFVVTEHVPGDAGGATKYGIDAASHPGISIETLTEEDAVNIYLSEFAAVHWSIYGKLPPALTEFPFPAAFAFFDCRENCGTHAAWLCAQRALALTADGIPGVNTRTAVLKADTGFANRLIDQRMAYHRSIAANHADDAQFLEGWLNRCTDLKLYLAKA